MYQSSSSVFTTDKSPSGAKMYHKSKETESHQMTKRSSSSSSFSSSSFSSSSSSSSSSYTLSSSSSTLTLCSPLMLSGSKDCNSRAGEGILTLCCKISMSWLPAPLPSPSSPSPLLPVRKRRKDGKSGV